MGGRYADGFAGLINYALYGNILTLYIAISIVVRRPIVNIIFSFELKIAPAVYSTTGDKPRNIQRGNSLAQRTGGGTRSHFHRHT